MDGSSTPDTTRQPPAPPEVARAPDGADRPGGKRGGGGAATAEALPPLDSADLLGGRPEVEIRHGGETYRLRQTRAGKLILTK